MKVVSITFLISTLIYAGVLMMPISGWSDTEQLVIVVNNTNPFQNTTAGEIRQIFLKERKNWKNGDKVFPINAKRGSKNRALFRQKILKMTENDENKYWQEQKIKKGLFPPPELTNVQKAVFSLKNSISYCLKSEYKAGTSKILLTI